MSDKDFDKEIGGNCLNVKYDETAECSKSYSRRTSTSSQHSLISCASPNYDSGNFSYSNTSDLQAPSYSSVEDDADSNDLALNFNLSLFCNDVKQLQRELKDKDQALTLTVNESKRMKSELERLNKSEKWYKNELKNQKRSKLELLEKLYLNERRFIQENQKLRSDYERTCKAYEEIEQRTMKERDSLVKQLKDLQNLFQSTQNGEREFTEQDTVNNLKFEIQKHKDIIIEKENLIEVLKRQKQTLLENLSEMVIERNSKMLSLEASSLTLEDENRKITKKCVSLVEEKKFLEEELKKVDELFNKTKNELCQRELEMKALRERFQNQLKEINFGNNEIERLKCHITQLEYQVHLSENNSDGKENAELLDAYKKELEIKNIEIEKLRVAHRVENEKVAKLQIMIVSLENLRENYESAKREIERLKFELQSKEFEAENNKIIQNEQEQKIVQLEESLQEYRKLRENLDKYIQLLQANNEILESKESNIEELKLINKAKIKEIEELQCKLVLLQQLVDNKDDVITLKCEEIEGLKTEYEAQGEKMEELIALTNENTQLKESVCNYQTLLEKNNLELSAKENEIHEFKILTDVQSKQINDLTVEIEEISKLRKEIDDFNEILTHKESEIHKLAELNSSQIQKIENLEKYEKEYIELSQLLKQKDNNLKERDIEIEALKLILKGQKAQIRRFNLKCYENEALREKLDESSKWIKNNQNVLDREEKELEYLKDITRRQGIDVQKLLEESGKNINFNNETKELNEEMDVQLCKIHMLRALLDSKSKRIIQLNNEREYWMTLLENLDIEKTVSNYISEENYESDGAKQQVDKNHVCTQDEDMLDDNTIESVKLRKIAIIEEDHLNLCSDSDSLNENFKNDIDSISIENFENNLFTQRDSYMCIDDIHQLYLEFKKKTEEFQNQQDKLENELKVKNLELNNLYDVIKNLNVNLEEQKEEINKLKEDYRNREATYTEKLSSLEQNMEKSLRNLETQVKLKQNELNTLAKEKYTLNEELCKYKKVLEMKECSSLDELINLNSTILNQDKCLLKSSIDDNCSSNEIDWRTRCRVIELENRKRISRYELHISTLLNNIKSYKKDLESMERKYKKLLESHELLEDQLKEAEIENKMLKSSYELYMERITTEKIREIKENESRRLVENSTQYCNLLSKDNDHEKSVNVQELQEMTRKYEESQKIVTVLKHQLETARKQFLEMDDYKRLSVELKLNLTNLMDDYKKLFYPYNDYKMQKKDIDAIYDLINRSNSFVPNLNNLSESIDTLKMDIKKISLYAVGRISPCRKLSLMDELKAADAFQYS